MTIQAASTATASPVDGGNPPAGDAVASLAADLPRDVLLAILGRPWTDHAAGAPLASSRPASTRPPDSSVEWLGLLGAAGLVSQEGQVFADVAAALPLLGRFPFAICTMELAVERPLGPDGRVGESVRLTRLQSALVLRTGGRNEDVLNLVNRLLQRYTNDEVAAISEHARGDDAWLRLTDRRLPEWAVIEWGRLDDCFVVSVGRGAFERMRTAHRGGPAARLSGERWFESAHRRADGPRANLEIYVDFAALRARIESIARTRWWTVLDALRARDVDRDLWSIGAEGRALTCRRCYQSRDGEQFRAYCEPPRPDDDAARVIPPAARRFAVLRGGAPWLFEHVPEAWVKARYFRQLRNVERWWRELQAELGIDVADQLLGRLGGELIVCDAPPHPLGIPFAVTVAAPVDDAAEARRVIDVLLEALSRRLDGSQERREDGSREPWDDGSGEGRDESLRQRPRDGLSGLLRVRLRRAEDGVWYLQAGILGPALCVTDRYLVASWSPQALREVRACFDAPGRNQPSTRSAGESIHSSSQPAVRPAEAGAAGTRRRGNRIQR